ncbi:RagB/SusD family nutrient uptake outer membrane protein [Pontibacter cellulosilyticus]|uniref:RagB/SusD family nutrient uptake outer membrane protein n=1 Tax=Pontibacter cellulosilyticus TaxID=1720253 RepID=A0A923N9F4_9BACT|nr:RagB/SusD family nutrient uptake outer membrane protein [Pontibacter cellulosilyticus]MBC5992855.1 RagB/SusD family nutrient uptake outer membrane protein [Pontibacter cellulosilyticus]
MKKFLKYKKSSVLLLAGLLAFSSCENALDVDPRQSIDMATALSSRETVNAAIASAYSRLKSARAYGRDMVALPEALADNGQATNRSGRLLNESNNVPGAHFASWQNYYYTINEVNLALDAIPSLNLVPAVSEQERNLWEGRLQFLRAISYFDLVRSYAYIPGAVVPSQAKGGVPLVLTGVKELADAVNRLPERAPIADVYAQIYADLKAAETKLGNAGTAGTSGTAWGTRVAAQALLARVALYNKDYATAKEYADKVIASHGSKLLTPTNYVAGWRSAVNPESLFEVTYSINAENIGVNESLQTTFTSLVTPGVRTQTGGFGDLVPTSGLLTALGITVTGNGTNSAAITARNSDVRNLLFELGTSGRGAPFVETTKYIGKNGFINLDNAPVLRIAEMYLIRAEVQATAGASTFNEVEALKDLVRIKTNRYSDYVGSAIATADAALTGSALYEEIIRQRRIEFAFEGHRFFDMKRLGRDIVKSPSNLLFTDFRILPSIPVRELDGNPNLVNNVGY